MPQADIEINAVAASNEDLPINTAVQFSNNDVGDETTYTWSILSQPPGAADALSSLVIENPTLLPQKEDTYLIRLIVDQGLPTEDTDEKLFRVRRFKSAAALVAIGEAISGTQGTWGLPQNETLHKLLDHIYDGDVVIAQAGGALTTGAAVQLDETNTIKAGLPGEERVPRANTINATDPTIGTKVVGIVLGKPDGNPVVLLDDMVLVRVAGFFDFASAGAPAIGDPVFIDDAGVLALAQGTNRKKVGAVIDDTGGAWRAFLSTLTEEGGLHALGGALHTVATLAQLNTKIAPEQLIPSTDARLSDARTPIGAAGGNLTGTYPNPTIPDPLTVVSAVGTTTFTGAAPTLVAGMTATPGAGTYLVFFNGYVDHSTSSNNISTFIYANGVQHAQGNRVWRRGAGQGDIQTTFLCMGLVTVAAGQAIEGRWGTTAATASMYTRHLILYKVP